MEPARHFRFCPACGTAGTLPEKGAPFRCGQCGFTFYFNAAIATAGFIRRPDGRMLFIRRSKDPGRGRLAPPGGFVDIGERAEEALRRELREEVGLEIQEPQFLCSFPNSYLYREVTYPVLDFFFTADAVQPDTAQALDGADEIMWLDPVREVVAEELAFDSMRSALAVLRAAGGLP